tara:strand:+ start:464 stop:673 length:210 start_codon:yes stop_codon:yes gene_type:complete
VKKTFQKNPNINNENNLSKGFPGHQVKTTDVNILLNRVRLDRKKNFKKKIFISIIFVFLLSSLIAYTTT